MKTFDMKYKDPDQCAAVAGTESFASFHEWIRQGRIGRTVQYYNEDFNFHELAVLSMFIENVDENLLYPLMGDPVMPTDPAHASKLDRLLDPSTSTIGICSARFWQLCEAWLQACVLDRLLHDYTSARM